MTDLSRIPTLEGDGDFPAYVARPDGGARAAIIVIPEIFGVNPGIRAKCDMWAARGYLAAAPDIFWRFAEGEELDPDVPEQFQKAIANMGKFDADMCIRDIEALDSLAQARGGLRQGRPGRILPWRANRLHGRNAHRYRRLGRLLRRDDRPDAGRGARHRPPADAPYPHCRPLRRARGPGKNSRGVRRSSQGDALRLRGSRPRVRHDHRRAPRRRRGLTRRFAHRGILRRASRHDARHAGVAAWHAYMAGGGDPQALRATCSPRMRCSTRPSSIPRRTGATRSSPISTPRATSLGGDDFRYLREIVDGDQAMLEFADDARRHPDQRRRYHPLERRRKDHRFQSDGPPAQGDQQGVGEDGRRCSRRRGSRQHA